MLDNKELFEIEDKISYLNLLLAGVLILYYLMFKLFGKIEFAPNMYVFACAVCILGIDFGMGKINYLFSEFLLKSIKFFELIVFSVFALVSGNLSINMVIAGVIYLVISVQLMVSFDITENYSKVMVVLFNIIPLTMVIVIYMIIVGWNNFFIFIYVSFLIVIIFCQIGTVSVMSSVCTKLYEKIFKLNGELTNNEAENISMKSVQERIIGINEQLSVQRFQLEEANRIILKNANEKDLLNSINKDAIKTLDVDGCINILLENIIKYIDVDLCYIGLKGRMMKNDEYEDELEQWHLYKYSEKSGLSNQNFNTLNRHYFEDEFIYSNVNEVYEDFSDLKFDFLRSTQMKSTYMFSKKLNSDYYILYIICKKDKNAFEKDVQFVNNLCKQTSILINNNLLYKKMHNMAVKDALTNIYNRQYYNTMCSEYMDKCMKSNRVLTVVMFDIDKFKNVNDTYGHIFGDEVIKFCGYSAKKFANTEEAFAVRYGGEEFVILFPDQSISQVSKICSEMHEYIKNKKFDYKGKEIHINISGGIASYPDSTSDANTIVSLADKALYYSKEHGRGRITIFDKSMNYDI